MSSTDVLKRLHRQSVHYLCGRPIVFHHVPKCGGTSIGRGLRRAYILSQTTVKPHESEHAFNALHRFNTDIGTVHSLREMMLLYAQYCECRCITAHVPFSEASFETFADTYAYVTMLREPVSRFISHYGWWNRPDRPSPSPEPLDRFVETDDARWMGSTYARYFSGDPDATTYTAKHIDAAIANLRRLNFVGFLDRLEPFKQALAELTGQRISIGEENVGRQRGLPRPAEDPAIRAKIEKLCAPDLEIWNSVQDLRTARPRPIAAEPAVAPRLASGAR